MYCWVRLLVQEKIYEKFVKRLVEVAGKQGGDPMSLDTHVGPVTTNLNLIKL